jgi:lipopolysaccharide transport system ATP-binding protein
LAAGLEKPASGEVVIPETRRLVGPEEGLNLAPVGVLLLDHSLARRDQLVRERAALALDRLRRTGTTTLLVSHEEDLLRRLCDEVWWIHGGCLAARGVPDEALRAYRRHVSEAVRSWGEKVSSPLHPRMRRGDGRAEVLSIETLGENGKPTIVLRSGELAVVRVVVRFLAAVADPVIGILIRTRVGLDVYGTNTELEGLKLGPYAEGQTVRLAFGFRCELCPQEYTITAASHDPDGTWHDWLEDAVAFAVSDSRYTSGVANLRATVRLETL